MYPILPPFYPLVNTVSKKEFRRRFPAKAFSWTRVNKRNDRLELGIRNSPKIAALRKEEAQEPIGIFIGASLPGLVRLSKVDRSSQSLFQALKVSELRSCIHKRLSSVWK